MRNVCYVSRGSASEMAVGGTNNYWFLAPASQHELTQLFSLNETSEFSKKNGILDQKNTNSIEIEPVLLRSGASSACTSWSFILTGKQNSSNAQTSDLSIKTRWSYLNNLQNPLILSNKASTTLQAWSQKIDWFQFVCGLPHPRPLCWPPSSWWPWPLTPQYTLRVLCAWLLAALLTLGHLHQPTCAWCGHATCQLFCNKDHATRESVTVCYCHK